jgi:hypothetical protein
MLFSVVIPTHNRAGFLLETIESVFAQEERDFEVLVVDDGSTDGTPDVLKRCAGRIEILRQENRGPAAARNLGIERAHGRYVAFLDSDDRWFPWTLAVYREAIELNGAPAMIAGTHVDFRSGEQPPMPARTTADMRLFADYFATARAAVWLGTCGVAIRTDALRSVGGFTTHAFNAEDSDLWLRLGTQPGFVRIASPPVFAYRRHDASAVASMRNSFLGTMEMIAREKSGGYPGGRSRRLERFEILARHTRPLSLACAHGGLRHEAARIYRSTLGWNLRLGRLRYLVAMPFLFLRGPGTRSRPLGNTGGEK